MFSRAVKSACVRSLGSRRIHIGEKNFKIALNDGAGEISQTQSPLLRNSTKLNVLALYNVATINRPLPNYNFYDEQPFKSIPSGTLTMTKKSSSGESSHSNATINNARQTDSNNHQGNNGRNQIEKLVEALYRLPITEKAPAVFNSPLIPIEEIMPKAGNACGRMRPYARVLGERDSSMKTWQRDYPTVAIRKWFPGLMYPSFQEHDLNFISETKISKKLRPIKKTRKIRHLSCGAPFAKENNHQSLPTSLLNHGEKPVKRLMKKFRNVGVPSNIEARFRTAEKSTDWVISSVLLNNKLRLLYEIYSCINFSSSSLNFTNRKRENNREVVSLNRDSETITDNTLNVVEQENWIQRICSKIKSILPDLHAKIRLHSTTADSYCSENIFAVNQVIPFSDIISNNAILFASKDCEDDRPKIGIRKKIQEFCTQRKKSLNKNRDKNDICKKRQKCKTEKKCQKRENICERKKIDCSERRKRTGDRQNVVSCKRRKNSRDKENARDCRKTREQKVEVQEDSCKQKKDDTSKTKKDPCSGQSPMKQKETFHKLHNTDPCRVDKKEEIEMKELHDTDPCRLDKKKEIEKKEWHDTDPCRVDKKEEIETKELHDTDPCRLDKKKEIEKKEEIKKKEETKKPDCEEIKKVDLCKKKTCPTVKRAPDCPEDDAKRKDC